MRQLLKELLRLWELLWFFWIDKIGGVFEQLQITGLIEVCTSLVQRFRSLGKRVEIKKQTDAPKTAGTDVKEVFQRLVLFCQAVVGRRFFSSNRKKRTLAARENKTGSKRKRWKERFLWKTRKKWLFVFSPRHSYFLLQFFCIRCAERL